MHELHTELDTAPVQPKHQRGTCMGKIVCTVITAAQEKILDLEKYNA